MNVFQEAYGLLNAWLISLDYNGSTSTFTLPPWGREKWLQSGPSDEGYSRSFCGNCQHSSNQNAALARGGLRVEGGGRCNESSNGRQGGEKRSMYLNPALWTLDTDTQRKSSNNYIVRRFVKCFNCFTDTYFKAVLLWYTLSCVKANRKTPETEFWQGSVLGYIIGPKQVKLYQTVFAGIIIMIY